MDMGFMNWMFGQNKYEDEHNTPGRRYYTSREKAHERLRAEGWRLESWSPGCLRWISNSGVVRARVVGGGKRFWITYEH
jgi:hypothetical protein